MQTSLIIVFIIVLFIIHKRNEKKEFTKKLELRNDTEKEYRKVGAILNALFSNFYNDRETFYVGSQLRKLSYTLKVEEVYQYCNQQADKADKEIDDIYKLKDKYRIQTCRISSFSIENIPQIYEALNHMDYNFYSKNDILSVNRKLHDLTLHALSIIAKKHGMNSIDTSYLIEHLKGRGFTTFSELSTSTRVFLIEAFEDLDGWDEDVRALLKSH